MTDGSPQIIAMDSIGERVKRLRNERDISQEGLARHVGVSMQTISMIERGATGEPKSATLSRIAAYFGVSLDFLTSGVEATAAEPAEVPKVLVDFLATPLGATCNEAEREHLATYMALVGPMTHAGIQMELSTYRYVRGNPPTNDARPPSPKGSGSGPRPRSVTPRGVAKAR